MSDSVEYEPEAIADLENLTEVVRDRIVHKINWLAENFDQITPQSLTADLTGFYKLRVGNYRVIYEFSREDNVITIDQIGHRSEIYR